MPRKGWFLIALAVVALGVAYGGYLALTHTAADHLTVTELKSRGDALYGQQVRVRGKVVIGSVDWNPQAGVTRFTLADEKERLDVVYRKIVPDTFKPGADLIITGEYLPEGIVEATTLGSSSSGICTVCHQ